MNAEALRLVLGVDVLVRAQYREDERAVLELWRDGLVRPVLHRPLLRRYLLALQRMGLEEPALRGWATWLASPEKSLYLRNTPEEEGTGEGNLSMVSGLYLEAARLGAAQVVVTSAARPEQTVKKRTAGEKELVATEPEDNTPAPLWLAPAEFLKRVREDN